MLFAAAIALAVVVVGGAVVAGALIERLPSPPTLLETLRSSGAIRVAVRPDAPQAQVSGGRQLAGFDIDVARQLGDQLALRTDIMPLTIVEMLDPAGQAWDVAMPSSRVPDEGAGAFLSTEPYYYWPFYVLVRSTSDARDMADLDGSTICVVRDSAGEDWLRPSDERPQPGIVLVAPPVNATTHAAPDDDACVAEVSAGDSDALVTGAWTEADFASRRDYRILGGGAAGFEGRVLIVRTDGPAPESLLAALNDAIGAMHEDGTLRRLSQARFGGEDLSTPPR
jgi:cystine transport system substrate-binding protein